MTIKEQDEEIKKNSKERLQERNLKKEKYQMTTYFDHFSYHLSCPHTFYFIFF